ncbi:MAG: VCBS repeat-containing protein [Pseudomonadota bacterium]
MHRQAPRRPARQWRRQARGALVALSFWGPACGFTVSADTITSARFTEPTTRYAHGVLGDNIEYGALELSVQSAHNPPRHSVLTVRLAKDRVFEDLAPRLVDVDGDGSPEAIVVESQAQQGAQLAIYNAKGQKIAATPHIGTRFRWLAPVGAADLDGDGQVEIAYIDRPHLAKILRIWRFENDHLAEIATVPDLTNHRIGEDFISGGLRDCGDDRDIILVSGTWARIVRVSYQDGWTRSDLGPFSGAASLARALKC